jgi:glycosyltransferase involved in cell wall biosynthesis
LAGVHRARHLAKHLPAVGWTPVVVAVDEAFQEERLDAGLAALVPTTVEVVKTRALPQRVCRPFGLGEISLRAWRPLRQAILRLLETREVGAVLITGSPYYPMLLAPEIKQQFRVPVVLDFQDPWVSAWGATLPRFSKGGVSHRLAEWLEPKAVRAADFVTSVSETQNGEMADRYPWLDRSRMAAIPIGGDPEDYDTLRQRPSGDLHRLFEPGAITLSCVGAFMPRTEPLMRVFLSAFAMTRRQSPEALRNVRLLFVGTSNQPNETDNYRVRPIAQALSIADAVREVPHRLPYMEAIGVLARSDGILLIGSDEVHYTASKIYPGLMSGRPYLSLFHKRSSSHEILSAAGGGISLAFEANAELVALEHALSRAIVRLVTDPSSLGHADPSAYAPYTARATAKQFAAIFNRLSGNKAERSGVYEMKVG